MTSNRLAASVALLFTRRRQCRRLNLGAEALERHDPIIISSGSPFAEITASRLSASKKPN